MFQLAQRVGLVGLASLRVLSNQAAGYPPLGLALLFLPTMWAPIGSSLGLLCPVVSPSHVISPHFFRTVGQPSVGQGVRLR